MTPTPQFPLGLVLFPGMMLPLHVFEPRYRQMVEHVLAKDGKFGVVLIERGREVGGNDERVEIGTLAQVTKAEQFDDGRWALLITGLERFRIVQWVDDDPYPQAEIEPWPDPTDRPASPDQIRKFVRCLAMSSELGMLRGPMPSKEELETLPSLALLAFAPLGSYDKQRLLACPLAEDRFGMLEAMLDDAIEILELQLSDGGV